jgi:PAS domain-containing protein
LTQPNSGGGGTIRSIAWASWSDRRSKEIYDVAEDKTDIEEFTKRVHPDDVEMVWAAIEAALDPTDPKPYAIEYRVQRGDGEVRWVEAHGLTYFEGWGASPGRRAVLLVGTVQDITERKRAEEEREKREREYLLMREVSHRTTLLEESRDRLQFALDAALLGWWQYDPIRGVVWGDTRLKEMFEIAEDWPNIEEFKRRVYPDDLERVWAAMEAAVDPTNPKPYKIEYRHRRADGEVRWIEAHALVRFEGSGSERRAVSLVGTGQDITERKRREEERKQQEENERLLMREVDHRATLLEESQIRLQLATDAANLGAWQYDPLHHAISGDTRYKEIFDVADNEKPIEEIMINLRAS